MAAHLTEQWLNESVLEPIRLPAVSPQVTDLIYSLTRHHIFMYSYGVM